MITFRSTPHRLFLNAALLAASALLALALPLPAAADLNGQPVRQDYLLSDFSLTTVDTVFGGGPNGERITHPRDASATALLGKTAYDLDQYPAQTVAAGGITFSTHQPGLTVTVTPTQIRLSYAGSDGTVFFLGGLATGTFQGIHLSESGASPRTITGVSVNSATSVPGFSLSNVTWNAGGVCVNVGGLAIAPGQNITLDVAAP